jgi:replicative DNA helicase
MSIDAERAVLGSILTDGALWDDAARSISVQDFSLDSHRRIFSCLESMAAAGEAIDLITVTMQLDRRRELQSVGDAGYLASLLDGVLPQNCRSYAKRVKQAAQTRALVAAARLAISRADDGESAVDISSGLIESCLDVEAQSHGPRDVTLRQIMPEVLRELEAQSEAGGLVGLPTGIDTLDETTGGFRKGELIVIGALPGAGKTALAVQIIAANAEARTPQAVFSLEMSRWDIGKRFLAAVTPVSASKIRHPRFVKAEEWKLLANGAARCSGWPLWLDDSGSLHITELLSRARLLIRRHGAKLIVVDYLQLVRADARDIRERVSKVADALRQLAKAEQVPVVLLSQLRRPQNVNDPPTLIDLKESGDIEAHAHVVFLLHCPTGPDGNPTGEDTLIVGKNRNGARGPVPLTFSPHKLQFYPREVRP